MSTAYNCECRFKVEWEDLSPSVQARFKSIEESSNYNNIISSMNSRIDSLQSQINIIQNSILDYDNKLNNITNNIPKKVSDLVNDSNYQTKDQIDKSINDTANSLTNTIEQNYYSKLDLKHRLRPPLKRNTSYLQGDICFHDSLPSYAYLECIQAGVTGPDEPSVLGGGNNSLLPPNSLSDGTTLFIVRDIRCKYRTGEIVALMGTPKEQDYLLLCDGSSINAELYPELVAVLGKNTLPNLIDGKFLEGWVKSGEYKDAGLPNITGYTTRKEGHWMNATLSNVGEGEGALFYANTANEGLIMTYNDGQFKAYTLGFDASRSNPIYGSSTLVQPRSMTIKYYICYAG